MAWIELHQTLPTNKKTLRLKALLKIPTPHAVGLMCMLWLWAVDNARDGDLSPFSPDELAEVCAWNPRRAEELQNAMVDSGFLDRDGDRLLIHDWDDYVGRLLEMKKKNIERTRKNRARSRNIRETFANVSGLPNQTQPDQTQPNQTQPKNLCGGGDGRAGEPPHPAEEFLESRGLRTESYLGVGPALIGELDALAEDILPRFWHRQPGELDRGKLFQNLCPAGTEPPKISEDMRDLLLYAFEQSVLTGHIGSWPYVEGVLKKLRQRGLKDLRDAEFYDLDREEG